MKDITFEEWVEKYKPIKNSLDAYAPYDGYMFETYGREFDEVFETDNEYIWTGIDGDNEDSFIVPGYHIVNRYGYFKCEIPWDIKDEEEVNLNEMISMGKAKYLCIEFIEEELNISLEEFEDKIHDWFNQKS